MPADTDTEKKKGKPFANLAKVLAGVGLPALTTAVGGPVAGAIVGRIGQAMGLDAGTDEDTVSEVLAEASPEMLVELRRIEADLTKAQLAAMTAEGAEITERHRTDMLSDSWLSKNVRPAGFAFALVAFALFAYLAAFVLTGEKASNAQFYAGLLQGIVMSYLGFYVSTRGVEKVANMVTARNANKGGSER